MIDQTQFDKHSRSIVVLMRIIQSYFIKKNQTIQQYIDKLNKLNSRITITKNKLETDQINQAFLIIYSSLTNTSELPII
jgi:hypothetical protein